MAVAVAVAVAAAVVHSAAGAPSERDAAISTIDALEADAKKKSLARDPLGKARDALERADSARASANHSHAALLEGLAHEWGNVAADLVRAAEGEALAQKTEKQAAEARTKAIRARALLEETIARRERSKKKLEELDQPAGPAAEGKK